MHLAFLTPEYPHPLTGPVAGLGTSIKNLTTELAKNGNKISVFVYGQKKTIVFTEGGIKFHLIKHRNFMLFGWYLHRKFLQNYLNKYIVLENIDAVEAPDWTGITAFMKVRCPFVIRFHGSDAYFCKLESRPQKQKNFWFEKIALEGANHLLSVSEFTAKETRKIFNLKSNIKVIPNSIDVKLFVPQHEQVERNTILYFGSIIRKKGILELAAIFNRIIEQLPEAQLKLAGRDVIDIKTGKSTRALFQQKLTPAAAKKIKWMGVLPYEVVLQEIAKAQVVVLPSFAEALPMTWIEAMSMEKAMVTSNIGWAKEVMIDGKTGFTVDPNDHITYATKVLLLLKDQGLSTQLGKAARERVLEKFSTAVVVNQNIAFYKKITGIREI